MLDRGYGFEPRWPAILIWYDGTTKPSSNVETSIDGTVQSHIEACALDMVDHVPSSEGLFNSCVFESFEL